MNKFKMLTYGTLSFGIIIGTGVAGNALANQSDASNYNRSAYVDGYSQHKKSKYGKHNDFNFGANSLSEVFMEQSKKALAQVALNALYVEADAETVDRFFVEDYIQHNPFGASGRDFVKSIFIDNKPESYKVDTGFMMVDGDYIVGHSRFSGFTDFYERPIIAIDVYRLERGKIVEHWDVIQEEVYPEETVSGSSMFPIAPTYEYVSEQQEKLNAEMVQTAVTGLANGDESVLDLYYSDDFINHNPTSTNGLDYLRGFASADIGFEVGFVIADGPYVAMQTRVTGFGPTPVITFDIFRVENNLIVEHWDVIQEEVPVENTVSGNPMFPIQ